MQDLITDSELHPNAVARLILAGARSVALATQVLVFIEDFKREQPEAAPALEALARHVVKDWGLDLGEQPPAAADETPPPADDGPLRWPPTPPELSKGYMDSYFHVREAVVGRVILDGDDELPLKPDMQLRYTGSARWEEGKAWWLRVSPENTDLTTWALHTNLKPGAEIPVEQP